MQPWLHYLVQPSSDAIEWVMLTYRLPREPSTPRSAVWRQLRRLGVAQLADGLVALPADARTREQLEWIADEVKEAGGTAGIWLARAASVQQQGELVTTMRAARATEYDAVRAEAEAASSLPSADRRRVQKSLRAELHRIRRRDFFPPVERDTATAAVEALASGAATEAHAAPHPQARREGGVR
jgi:hypothetical protein